MKTPILAFTVLLMMCLGARAELKWEQTSIELHPAANDKQAIGHFKYQNTGSTPVHFKSVHASCGCTTAQSQKEEVPPGDKGEITATFNIGDRTGTQVKTVTVETDEATNQRTVLTLKAEIPQQLEITPSFVFWKQGDKADTKTINVKVGKDFTVKRIEIFTRTPGCCSGSLGAFPCGRRGGLLPRQDFVALRHCAVGNGDCRAGARMGRQCDLG